MKNYIANLHRLTIVMIVLMVGLMCVQLGRDYLYDWDEGIYGQIGREMYVSHNLLTPTWNGSLWLEKPPLIGWVTSLGIAVAGQTELGARLFMPLFAGLTLYAIFRLGEKIGGTLMGTMSASILGYFNLFLARTRAVNTDGMLLAAITWTSWLILAGSSPWLVGFVMGLAVMVKGPAGLLALFIALPLLYKKSRSYLKFLLCSFLATTLPWHLYSYLVHGQSFITPYFLEQVVRRATVPIEFHTESRWFYLQYIYEDLGLGVLLVALLGLVTLGKELVQRKITARNFLIGWWVALPLVIFTLAKTRLSWYILPVYPGIALAIGYGLSRFDKNRQIRAVLMILGIGMLTQMLYHGYLYIAPFRPASPLAETVQVAITLSKYKGERIAMLVSANERVAQAILPTEQTISSSFRYGGAPSIVWYSQKHVEYYYNYDDFIRDTKNDKNINLLIVSTGDIDKVDPSYTEVVTTKSYVGYAREATYAQR